MTHEEQETERALLRAEHDWLKARGWTLSAGHGTSFAYQIEQRFSHPAAPKTPATYTRRDAVTMTRGEPLKYRRAR